jgi:hypothetical protein
MDIFGWIPGYTKHIADAGKEPLFLLLLAFLIAFSITRGYTRLARKRGWGSGNVGGVHLHHIVPGMIIVLIVGVLSFSQYADSDLTWNILAIFFGIGAALILDEFALIFHLKDVYWTTEGRSSVDAIVLGVLLAGLMLVTSSPFQLDDDTDPSSPRGVVFGIIAANLVFAVLTFAKGKTFTGSAAIFIPICGWVGAIRLAKPYSPWAHRRYDPERATSERARLKRARKLERSWHRYEHGRVARFERWLIDAVGGKPHPLPAEASAAALPPEAEAAPRR